MRPGLRLALGLAIELLALGGIAALGNLRLHVLAFLFMFALACVGLAMAWSARHSREITLAAVVLIALVLRAPFFFTTPSLSDDVWRYLHDGRAQLARVSPYAYAPADQHTAQFRGDEHGRINHPHLVTIYPPAAQVTFAVNGMLGSSILGWRLLLLASELVLLLLLARVLQQRRLGLWNLVLCAWHPLAVVEIAGSAHMEPIGIALMLAGLVAAGSGAPVRAGLLFGASIAFKFIAAPVLFVTRYAANRKLLATAIVIVIDLYVLYWSGGAAFGSLGTFAVQWQGNAGMYALLAALTDGHRARILAATFLICALLVIRSTRASDAERAALAILALLLASPVVHPWYMLWLLCLLPLVEQRWLWWTIAAWSVVVVFAYAGGAWVWLEYALVYTLLLRMCAPQLGRFRPAVSGPTRRRTPQIPT